MTDNEIRLKIAELRGYKDNGVMNDGAHEFYLPEGVLGQYFYIDGRVCDPKLPDWPTDISAAWELVEEMAHTPGRVSVQVEYVGHTESKLYSLVFRDYPTEHSVPIVEHDENPARAICLAWLKWRDGE